MKYHIPKYVSDEELEVAGISSTETVTVEVMDGAKKIQCLNNVKLYLTNNEGVVQFGWLFSKLSNVILKLHAHAVVKRPDGSLICVTPPESNSSAILFSPDDSIKALVMNNRLPTKTYSLVEDCTIRSFVKLENLESQMRLDGNILAINYIAGEKIKLSSELGKICSSG